MKRNIRRVLILLFAIITIMGFFTSPIQAKNNPVISTQASTNPELVLTIIKTNDSVEIKNTTVSPLILDKEGYRYEPLNILKPLLIKTHVKITSDNIMLCNAIIEGNLYVSANNSILIDLKVSGTVFIDPGENGVWTLDNVAAKKIEVVNNDASEIQEEKNIDTDASDPNEQTGIAADDPFLPVQTDIDTDASVMPVQTDIDTDGFVLPMQSAIDTDNSILPLPADNDADTKQPADVESKVTAKSELKAFLEIITVADYNDKLIVVNKARSLPGNWKPKDLVTLKVPYQGRSEAKYMRKEAADKLTALFAKAKKNKINITAVSGFRSYELQKVIYAKNVTKLGEEIACMISALSGRSEHQTGLAIDISSKAMGYTLNQSFGTTREGKWIKENCAEFGFIIRYPKGKEAITGYTYEPWHLRYIGKEVAAEITSKGTTLEEYFEIKG